MDVINWSNYDSSDFTYFCNALLSFEFGDKFQPFSAPGRDGGIDGLYNGSYGANSGKWRFQYKFHKAGYRPSISLLKNDIKQESKKLNEEVDHFILLSNVELLPPAAKELQETWDEQNIENVIFEIWDGAKLFNLSLKYPLLSLWLSDGFNTAQLIDYKAFFNRNLISDPLEPISLHNFYVENTNVLSALRLFISSNNVMFNLAGEAGLGKTRAIIEFFKILQSEDESWVPLVLSARSIDYDKIVKALSADKKHIVLIDDAHTYPPILISDLFTISKTSGNKIKLVLTLRPSTPDEPKSLIKEYDQNEIQNLEIEPLSREQTRDLFLHYLSSHTIKTYIDELVKISYGKPIVIVAMLNAILKGKNIAEVKENAFLQNYVYNYFKALATKLHAEHGIPAYSVTETIQGIALVEPINFGHEQTLNSLSDSTGLKKVEIEMILQELRTGKFVDGRWEHSIKPDFYSDILLAKITQTQIQNYLIAFPDKMNNVIINLSSAGNTSGSQTLLNDLIDHYISEVKLLTTTQEFEKISRTVSLMGGSNPEAPLKLIKTYLDCIQVIDSIFAQELLNLNKAKNGYSNYYKAISSISSHLTDLLYKKEYYSFVFESVFLIQRNFKVENELKAIYRFGKADYFDRMKLNRQTYFTNRVNDLLHSFTENEVILSIEILNSFLPLEYIVSGSSLTEFSFNITTYYISNSPSTDEFRKKVILTLFKIFNECRHTETRLLVLKSLLDLPRAVFASKRTKSPYDGSAQIEMALSFMSENTGLLTLREKSLVKDQLQYLELWDKEGVYADIIITIKTKLIPTSLLESVTEMLSRTIGIGRKTNYQDIITDIAKKSKQILSQVGPIEVANTVIEAHKLKGNDLIYFGAFYSEILSKDEVFLSEFYEQIYKIDLDFFVRYAAPVLRVIRFKFANKALFLSMISSLLEGKNPLLTNVLIDVYSSLSEAISHRIDDDEINMIDSLIKRKDRENYFSISQILPTLAKHDLQYARQISFEYFDSCSQQDAEYCFMWLTSPQGYCYELFSEILITKTYRFSITYHIEAVMNLVLKKEGIIVVFQYFKNRFDYFLKSLNYEEYSLRAEFVPAAHSSDLFNEAEAEREAMFKMALEWYIRLVDERWSYFAKNIFEYLSESDHLDPNIIKSYEEVANSHSGDPDVLNLLLASLSSFTAHQEPFISLVLKIYEQALTAQTIPKGLVDDINSNAYIALTNTGVKSGTPGEPFAEDVSLYNLLKEKIDKISDYHPAYGLLTSAIKTMQGEINRGYDLNNETW